MQNGKDLELLIGSSSPLIVVETHEELRLMGLIKPVIRRLKKPAFRWSVTEGLQRLDIGSPADLYNNKPLELLTQIKLSSEAGIYMLLDFHPYLDEPVNVRLLKDIVQRYVDVPHSIILIAHDIKLPPELKNYSVNFELSLPDRDVIETIIRKEARSWSKMNDNLRITVDKKILKRLIDGMLGLPLEDIKHLTRSAIRNDGVLTETDIGSIMQEKFKLLNQGGILSFEYDTSRFADVGGLVNLKDWLDIRRDVFNGSTSIPGLDSPKGILLLGVQGCGKSLAAKAVAGAWGCPLLRLDFGSLYNKYHGETEKNLRESLKSAEIMSPCILWIDEIEKGISVSDNDGGTSKRLLGTLLTWMAENDKKIFIVATANDIHALPPELLRKGRLDEIFFVDLPDADTRKTILRIHLQKREQDIRNFDLQILSDQCEGFSGAEIEQAVISAIYRVHATNKRLGNDAILQEINSTRPLSVVMSEKINALREWAQDRTVLAG